MRGVGISTLQGGEEVNPPETEPHHAQSRYRRANGRAHLPCATAATLAKDQLMSNIIRVLTPTERIEFQNEQDVEDYALTGVLPDTATVCPLDDEDRAILKQLDNE